MATTVDTLLVRIEADMADLKRDLSRVTKLTERSGERMENAFRKVGRAIAAVGGAYVFGNFIKSTIQTGSEIEALRVQLDALLGSAEQGGKAFEQMSEFAGRVPFSLAEIQSGAGSLAAASDNADQLGELLQVTGNIAAQFGIPFNEAAANVQRALSAGIGAADQFRDRGVSAFAGFEAGVSYSAGETAAKLIEHFGTGGTADGAMDAFAKTTAGTLSMFGDAMHRMRGSVAESGLNEGFRDLVRAMTDVLNASGPLSQAIGGALGAAFSALADAIRMAQAMFRPLVDLMQSAIQIVKTIGIALYASFGPQLEAILDAVNIAFKVVHDNLKLIVTAAILYKTVNIAAAILDGAVQAIRFARSLHALALAQKLVNIVAKRSLGFYVAIAALFATITGLSGELERAIIAVGNEVLNMLPPELRKDFGDFASELDGVRTAFEEAQAALTQDGPLKTTVDVDPVKQAAADLKAIQEALANQGGTTDKLKEKLEKMKPVYDAQVSAVKNLASGMSDAFAEMFVSGKFNMESLANVFQNFTRTMIAKALELFVINKILGAVFGLPTHTFGSGATILTGGLATGGSMSANRPYLVGERGPELIVPNSASTVMNSNNTRSALGGGDSTTIVQNINISTGVQQTVRAEIRSLMPEIANTAKAAVADGKRRGGSYGRAFA